MRTAFSFTLNSEGVAGRLGRAKHAAEGWKVEMSYNRERGPDGPPWYCSILGMCLN
jgi:hypothetical protein